MADIRSEPYAEWLEEALRDLVGLRPVSIGMVVLLPDGHTATNYWQADGADRWAMIRSIAQDSLVDWIRANADTIQEILDGEEDSDADA